MAKINNLREVYIEQLKDIYSAETQLTKALPKDGQGCHRA